MSAAGSAHSHEDGGHKPFDWFTMLDILVWSSVVLILILGAEWAYGTFVRERISREAGRYLAKASAAEPTAE